MNIMLAILIPVVVSLLLFADRQNSRKARIFAVAASVLSAVLAVQASITNSRVIFPWLGGVFDFALYADGFAAEMIILSSLFSALALFYSFYSNAGLKAMQVMLAAQGCITGALASDSLAVMAFFTGLLPLCFFFKENNAKKESSRDLFLLFLT